MRVGIRRRVGRAVQIFQSQLLASVQHVQQQPAVAVVIVHRLDDPKVGRELHEPVAVSRRQRNVRDHRVVRMRRIHREVRQPVNLLVPPHVAETCPSANGFRFVISV